MFAVIMSLALPFCLYSRSSLTLICRHCGRGQRWLFIGDFHICGAVWVGGFTWTYCRKNQLAWLYCFSPVNRCTRQTSWSLSVPSLSRVSSTKASELGNLVAFSSLDGGRDGFCHCNSPDSDVSQLDRCQSKHQLQPHTHTRGSS